MKWIGQHIYDQISRFRDDVYLEDIATGTIASGGNLGLDSNNKIVKATETAGDITSVVAGVGLSGGATSGAATLTVDLSEFSDVTPVNGDKLATLDSDGSTEQLTTVASLATLFAGSGLTATNSVIAVDATQEGITSLGVLESLTVTNNVTLGDGRIVITGDEEDTFTITTGASGATTMTTHDEDGTGGHFEIDADGDIILDSARQIKLEPAAGADILLDGVLSVDAGVVIPVATAHNAAGTAVSIGSGSTTAGTTNNIAGGNLTIHGGQGKGSGAGGDIVFKTANAGGSGSSLNVLATALTISDDLSATFAGAIVGDVTGNASGTAATVTAGTQAAITTCANLTTVGTIGTGTWNADVIPSAKLDADTAHYSAQRQLTFHNYKANQGTTETQVGLADADSEYIGSGTTNVDLPLTAAVDGKLLKIYLRSNKNLGGHTLTWRLNTQAPGVNYTTGPSTIGTVSGAGCNNTTMTNYDFSGVDNDIDAGDAVYLTLQSDTDFGNNVTYYITCLWEWDLS